MTSCPAQARFFFSGDMFSINKFVHCTAGAMFLKCCFIIDKIRFRIIKRGGELPVQNKHEKLGDIIKIARENSEYTIEELSEKVGISERYLYKIENEGKKPSYDVLYKLIRILSISPDSIFYPEKNINNQEIEYILLTLSKCDSRYLKVIKTIIKELIDLQQANDVIIK